MNDDDAYSVWKDRFCHGQRVCNDGGQSKMTIGLLADDDNDHKRRWCCSKILFSLFSVHSAALHGRREFVIKRKSVLTTYNILLDHANSVWRGRLCHGERESVMAGQIYNDGGESIIGSVPGLIYPGDFVPVQNLRWETLYRYRSSGGRHFRGWGGSIIPHRLQQKAHNFFHP